LLLLLISVGITVFLIVAALMLLLSGKDAVDARLMEISAPPPPVSPVIVETPTSGLARAAVGITSIFKPIRGIVSGSDEDLAYRLTLAGFRKAKSSSEPDTMPRIGDRKSTRLNSSHPS